jgi:hypothetical protein
VGIDPETSRLCVCVYICIHTVTFVRPFSWYTTFSAKKDAFSWKMSPTIHPLPLCRNSPARARAASFLRFLDHTQWHITFGRTPLEQGSARRRALYLATHSIHKKKTSNPPAGFEPAISAIGRRPFVSDRSATGIGSAKITTCINTGRNWGVSYKNWLSHDTIVLVSCC